MALIHTCYRITDVDRSVAFYEALGFAEVGRIPIRDEAVNVFMNKQRMTNPELTQGSSKTVQLTVGDYITRVKPAGSSTTVLGPTTLSYATRTAVQLYIVGNSTVGYKFLRINQDVVRPV